MKKILPFIVAVLFTGSSHAQIEFGVKAGLNLSTMHQSKPIPEVSYNTKASFNAGGMVYIPLFDHFGLQPEIVYSAEGAKVKTNAENTNNILGYINVPVLFKYRAPTGFFAELGVQTGFLLTARRKVQSSSLPSGIPGIDQAGDNVNTKDYYKSVLLSGAAGIGYLSSLNIGIDVRYNLGFTNIVKPITIDGTPLNNSSTYKNNTLQLAIFYMFGNNKK